VAVVSPLVHELQERRVFPAANWTTSIAIVFALVVPLSKVTATAVGPFPVPVLLTAVATTTRSGESPHAAPDN